MRLLVEKILSDIKFRFLFFGGIAAVVNIAIFYLLVTLGVDYKAANVIAIICAKLAAYVTLKRFVFNARSGSVRGFLSEFFKFVCSRLFSSCIDYFGVIVLVEIFSIDGIIAKIIMGVISTVVNYLISRYFVFVK